MSFLETIPRLDSRGQVEQDSAWSKSFRESLPLKGTSALMLDRSVPSTKQLKDELALLGVMQLDLVTNPMDFFRLVSERNYDFIFCDYGIDDRRTGAVILEELRHRFGGELGAAVIAVSGDRSSQALVNLLEFEPDAFLIKPFSAEELSRRVIRIHARRMVLQSVHRARRQGKHDVALQLCDDALNDFPQYERELMRTKVEILNQAGMTDDAERLLKSVNSASSPSWMDLELALLSIKRGELNEAESWLRKAISHAPHYIRAFCQLADLLIAMRREEEALSILEGLNGICHPSIRRLRQMADLADMLGYAEQKRNYLNRVVEKAQGTLLMNSHDYYRLAQTHLEQRRADDAYKVVARLRSVVDANESELAESMLMVYNYYINGDTQRARSGLEEVAKRQVSKGVRLSSGGQTLLMTLCARLGLQKKADSLYAQLLKNTEFASTRAWLKRQMTQGGEPKMLGDSSI